MKNLVLLFTLFLSSQVYSQINLFELSADEYNNLTNSPENSISLNVNEAYLNLIKDTKPCEFEIIIPFLDGTNLKLNLESFNVFKSDFKLVRNTSQGVIVEDYNPKILSYRIKGENISGIFNFLIGYLF